MIDSEGYVLTLGGSLVLNVTDHLCPILFFTRKEAEKEIEERDAEGFENVTKVRIVEVE